MKLKCLSFILFVALTYSSAAQQKLIFNKANGNEYSLSFDESSNPTILVLTGSMQCTYCYNMILRYIDLKSVGDINVFIIMKHYSNRFRREVEISDFERMIQYKSDRAEYIFDKKGNPFLKSQDFKIFPAMLVNSGGRWKIFDYKKIFNQNELNYETLEKIFD